MGVLNIGTGLTVKIEDFIPGEGYILDPIVAKIAEYHSTNAHLTGNLFFLSFIHAGIFLLNDLQGFLYGLRKDILQQDYLSLASSQLFPAQAYYAEGDVEQFIVPVIAHELNNLEPLFKVQTLSSPGNIYTFFKIVGILPVDGGCYIPSGI